jgi:hypothetical protein
MDHAAVTTKSREVRSSQRSRINDPDSTQDEKVQSLWAGFVKKE